MSNEPYKKTVAAFGRVLSADPHNYIDQVDNDTVIITPRFNTKGLQELKVYEITLQVSEYVSECFVLGRRAVALQPEQW